MVYRCLILLFFFNVVYAADTTSLSCLARYFRELEASSVPKVNVHPIQKISEFLPVHNNSWEKRYPGLSKKIETIYQSFPDIIAYFKLEPTATLNGVMDIIVNARVQKAIEMENLAKLYTHEPLLEKNLMSASKKLHMDETAKNRLAGRLQAFGHEVFDPKNSKHTEILKSYEGTLYGELGELLIATRVGDIEARGIKYVDLFNGYAEPMKSRALAKMEELSINGEIDLIYKNEKGKTVWGEVKNYKDPIDVDAKNFEVIKTQAIKTQNMIKALGGKIEPHLFLVNGLTDRAKLALENLGIFVHGKVK